MDDHTLPIAGPGLLVEDERGVVVRDGEGHSVNEPESLVLVVVRPSVIILPRAVFLNGD
jgi:hypothetical protein